MRPVTDISDRENFRTEPVPGAAFDIIKRDSVEPEPVDADTVRRRALDDARGLLLREGVTYRAGGETHWQLRRSLRGRVNQVDLVVDGVVWRTGARRDADKAVRRGKWPSPQPQRMAA